MSYIKSKEDWKLTARSFKEWKSTLDDSRNVDAYHSHLQKFIYDCPSVKNRPRGGRNKWITSPRIKGNQKT